MTKRSRRANGTGSIYQRGRDGRWIGYWTVTALGGPERRTVSGATRAIVEDRLRALQARDAAGEFMRRTPANKARARRKATVVPDPPVSARLRFTVLERDQFRCRYCGVAAPDVPLHVDHIVPLAAGGRTVLDNLVTACRDCNLGKAGRLLTAPTGPPPPILVPATPPVATSPAPDTDAIRARLTVLRASGHWLITPQECAASLDIPYTRCLGLIAGGALPHVRLGAQTARIPIADLLALLDRDPTTWPWRG